jgi:hypothetical protein
MAKLIFSFTCLNLGMRQETTEGNVGSKSQCAIVSGVWSWKLDWIGGEPSLIWSDEPIGGEELGNGSGGDNGEEC